MKHIEIFENERAAKYDEFIQNWILNYSFVLDILPKLITLENPTARDILVVGSGTGNEIKSLVQYPNQSWQIAGVDPSPDMINIAKNKLQSYEQVTWHQTDLSQFKVKGKFDVATLFLVLHFMPDDGTKLELLRNIAQRVKVGASFILFDMFGSKLEYARNLKLLELHLMNLFDKDFIREKIQSMHQKIHPISEERLTELLHEVGFTKPRRFFHSAIYGAWITTKI